MQVNIVGTSKKKADVQFAALKEDELIKAIFNASPEEIKAYITKNVTITNIKGIQEMFRKILVTISYLVNKEKEK